MTIVSDGAPVLIQIARVGELCPGQTKKFLLPCRPGPVEAFLLNHHGTLLAYLNRCRHVAMTMDWVENQFFTEDRAYILCATHGACYRPDTGECVNGPPLGKRLIAVPLTIRAGRVFATLPEELRDGDPAAPPR